MYYRDSFDEENFDIPSDTDEEYYDYDDDTPFYDEDDALEWERFTRYDG